MNERDEALMRVAIDRLRPLGEELRRNGWKPELIVFAPTEIERIPGYKVALVVPLDAVAEAPDQDGSPFTEPELQEIDKPTTRKERP